MSHSGIGAILRAADPLARALPLITLARLPAYRHYVEQCAVRHTSDDDELADALYILKKKYKILYDTHPNNNNKLIKVRTLAFKHYRRDGMIRSRSWSIEEQLKKWYLLIETWEADRDKEGGSNIIQPNSRRVQGTVEAMKAVIPCIKQGCLQDPCPMQKMYLETKVQPITGLQV